MHIEDVSTGEKIEVEVVLVAEQDFDNIKQLNRFDFDWDELKEETVYKLVPIGTNDMAGLIALIDHPEEGFCYIQK
jgi:hypothetical protein